jgi:hypothetical protein
MNDIAIISCFFSFKNYKNPKRNFLRWKRQMDSLKIPNYGIELGLDPYRFLTNDKNWKRILCNSKNVILFQKEALWNEVEKMVPKQYTKIILCDSDIWFENPNWISEVSKELDTYNVCSPCENFLLTDSEGRIFKENKSFGYSFKNPLDKSPSHHGLSIAFKRSFWKEVGGLYPYCIAGNGDIMLTIALEGSSMSKFYSIYKNKEYIDWYNLAKDWCNKSISFIKGNCYHEYHGEWNDRQYISRSIFNHLLDISKHLKFNKEGYLEWTENVPIELKEHIKTYFFNRNEDNIMPNM